MTTLIHNGAVADDPYRDVADDAALPDGPVIVSLTRWRAERDVLIARNSGLGVKLPSDISPETLGSDLDHLSLVVLEFAKFRDGRGFSWARLLRTRLGFKGDIRASGDYLFDQIAYLKRVGINSFVLPTGLTPDLYARALAEMSKVYQPSADGRAAIMAKRTASPA